MYLTGDAKMRALYIPEALLLQISCFILNVVRSFFYNSCSNIALIDRENYALSTATRRQKSVPNVKKAQRIDAFFKRR
jgi:hypothetical protein